MAQFVLYLFTGCISFACAYAALCVLARAVAPHFLDRPGGLKKHTQAVPVLGGSAIFFSLVTVLVLIRLSTQFPSGTLHSLRGIILGSTLIFGMGLWDDLHKPQGLPVWAKLLIQALATGCLIYYGIVIHVFPSPWISYPLTFLWVVGLTNAFNLLDIMDGLCATQAMLCTLGLTVIALPSEFIYVNFAALTLLGACGAFLPSNFSATRKIFLGDSGSNLLGFLIAALCLATGYSRLTNWGFLAPLLIAFIPIADITFVVAIRLWQGKNPLKGSDDHAALRLRKAGLSDAFIVSLFASAALACNIGAWFLTVCPPWGVVVILLLALGGAGWAAYALLRLGEPRAH